MELPVDRIAFFDYQRIDPVPGFLLSLEAFDEPQHAIFEFESQIIESVHSSLQFAIGFFHFKPRNRAKSLSVE